MKKEDLKAMEFYIAILMILAFFSCLFFYPEPVIIKNKDAFMNNSKQLLPADLLWVYNETENNDGETEQVIQVFTGDDLYNFEETNKYKELSKQDGVWYVNQDFFDVNETDTLTLQSMESMYFNEKKYIPLQETLNRIYAMGFRLAYLSDGGDLLELGVKTESGKAVVDIPKDGLFDGLYIAKYGEPEYKGFIDTKQIYSLLLLALAGLYVFRNKIFKDQAGARQNLTGWHNEKAEITEEDIKAIGKDFETIGKDIESVFTKYETDK